MQALLDTHALLWWLSDDSALTKPARKLIADTKNLGPGECSVGVGDRNQAKARQAAASRRSCG